MEVFKAIKERRSVRVFKSKEVEPAKIEKIVEMAVWAPSACNRQGWKFLVLKGRQLDKLIGEGTASFVKDAPLAILVLYEKATDNEEYHDSIQSAAAAIQNMHLAAFSLGLGSCWVANLPTKEKLVKIFEIPDFYEPVALVAIGYPKNSPVVIKRKYSIKELLFYNRIKFSPKEGERLKKEKRKLFLRGKIRKIYERFPQSWKKVLAPLASRFEKKKFQ